MSNVPYEPIINVAGLQLAFFELLWGIFPWIDKVFVKGEREGISILIQCSAVPSKVDWEDCCRLVGEIVDPNETGACREIISQHNEPTDGRYLKVMSSSIFREIAEEVAPWRLKEGR